MTGFAVAQAVVNSPRPASSNQRVSENLADLPLLFEPNVGQDKAGEFLSRGRGYSLSISPSRASFAFHRQAPGLQKAELAPRRAGSSSLTLHLVGADSGSKGHALQEARAKTFYYLGNDRSKWRRSVPNYERVNYPTVYPGVDLAYYGKQGQLEYDFIINPGASAKPISFAVDGAWTTKIGGDGELIVTSENGEIRWRKPLAYQEINGQRKLIAARFVLQSKHRFGFKVADYDHAHSLVIDPVIVYSTYLGNDNSNAGVWRWTGRVTRGSVARHQIAPPSQRDRHHCSLARVHQRV